MGVEGQAPGLQQAHWRHRLRNSCEQPTVILCVQCLGLDIILIEPAPSTHVRQGRVKVSGLRGLQQARQDLEAMFVGQPMMDREETMPSAASGQAACSK